MIEYFAYGSNSNLPHLQGWLQSFGVEPEGASDPRRVILPNYRLRTNYVTSSGLGAANIEPCGDVAVEGILLTISPDVLEALRSKEGWPRRYHEICVEVGDPSRRRTIQAVTYQVTPEHRLPMDVPVSRKYRKLILNGAKDAKLSRIYQSYLRTVLMTPTMFDSPSTRLRAVRESTDEVDVSDRRCA